MRFLRRTVTAGALGALAGLAISFAPAVAQTPLAIERDPPLATRPVAPAPILVPQTSGVPVPANPPAPVAPIVVPPGPAPVAVPAPTKPDAAFVPKAPEIQPSTGHAVAPKPAEAPAEKAAPTEPAPTEKPAVAAPEPAPSPVSAPEAAPTASPAPSAPPAPAPETPSPVAPVPAAPAAPAPSEVAPPPRASTAPAVEEVTVAPRDVLFVTGVTTWEKAEEQVGEAFERLAKATEKLRVEKTGGPLVEYIESDSDDVGFRAMVPITAAPKGKPPKGVKVGRSPSGPALKFRHDGPIDDLEEVYARIDDEVTKRGVDARSIVEEYDGDALVSPEDRVVIDVWVFLK